MLATSSTSISTVVIGAGPIGLAAAAHLAERALPFVVVEAAVEAAAADIIQDGHYADANACPLPRGDGNAAAYRLWEMDEYGPGAKRGRIRGLHIRERQDRNAEDGGA